MFIRHDSRTPGINKQCVTERLKRERIEFYFFRPTVGVCYNRLMFTELFTILPLTCAIFVVFFGFFILSKAPQSRMHQLLFGFCVSMFFWMFGTFMMFGTRVSDVDRAIFWDRFVYIGVVFMPSLMHHFSLIFTQRQTQRRLLFFNYVFSFLFLILSRTSYFVDGLYVYEWGAHTKAQVLHHIFLGYFFIGTGLFFYNVWSHYRRLVNRVERLQSLYVFLAFAIVIFIGGSAYLYAYGIDTRFPFAYLSGLVFPVMLFYAVTRHHLLGAKIIGTEVLVGIANFVLITEIFLSRGAPELVVRVFITAAIGVISFLLIQSVGTEVKRREEVTRLARSLELANARLQELDKQKTEFLSIASHQLRTPLSIIKGYIELLEDRAYGRPTKQMQEVFDNMDQSNERLVHLVDEFLNISRIEQGRTKFTYALKDVNETVTSAVNELQPKAKVKGLLLQWKPVRSLEHISVDDEKLRHVIFNFIDNAIKYSERGTIMVSLKARDGGLIFRVRDQGIGFDTKDQVNFFQKFYRGDNVKHSNVNGTGLGIYVCRKFIETHGGQVWAKSPGVGKGSEFGFSIPYDSTLRHEKAESEVER